MKLRNWLTPIFAALFASLWSLGALADDKIVKIGVLTDLSSLYADLGGPGSTLAAQMAVEDSGLTKKGWTIDVTSGDHQNKPDVGVGIARKWFDEDKVDVIADVPNSGVALAVAAVVKEKNGVFLNSGAATSDLTGKACTPNTVHWTYDTYTLANGTGKAVVKAGGDTWFFLTADYAFGHALQRDTSAVVEANGGKVLGSVNVPLEHAGLLLVPAAGASARSAKIIGLANAGGDTTNSIKQAHEFGIAGGGQKLAALLLFISDVNALGLEFAQGLQFTETFYWDMNDGTRAFSKRFCRAHEEPRRADDGASGRLCLADPLLQGARGARRQSARRRQGGRQDEGNADRRSAVRQGHDPRRRPHDPSGLSVRSQVAGGIEIPLGLLQADRDHSGRARRSGRWRRASARWSRNEIRRCRMLGDAGNNRVRPTPVMPPRAAAGRPARMDARVKPVLAPAMIGVRNEIA